MRPKMHHSSSKLATPNFSPESRSGSVNRILSMAVAAETSPVGAELHYGIWTAHHYGNTASDMRCAWIPRDSQ